MKNFFVRVYLCFLGHFSTEVCKNPQKWYLQFFGYLLKLRTSGKQNKNHETKIKDQKEDWKMKKKIEVIDQSRNYEIITLVRR